MKRVIVLGNTMRKFAVALLVLFTSVSFAQSPARPPNLQPIPEPPPLPAGSNLDPSLEPQVTIIKRGVDTIEEHRVGGRLFMLKVIPPHGVPYYLIDQRGDGQFTRQDSFDTGIRVPMWVIRSF
jgi:hypothetical protein